VYIPDRDRWVEGDLRIEAYLTDLSDDCLEDAVVRAISD
jgi:hypothetical protein